VYFTREFNIGASTAAICTAATGGRPCNVASKHGAMLRAASAAAGRVIFDGAWAVTAP
jgi:hypothetical protein